MTRFCHAAFVQGALRQAAFMNPKATVSALGSVEGARALLLGLWKIVKDQAKAEGKVADLDLSCMSVHAVSLHAYPTVLVSFPPPEEAGEAHFAALVLRSCMADDGVCLLKPPLLFYTLERAESLPEVTRTEFCQWTESGNRVVISSGPPPVIDAFAEAINVVVAAEEDVS